MMVKIPARPVVVRKCKWCGKLTDTKKTTCSNECKMKAWGLPREAQVKPYMPREAR